VSTTDSYDIEVVQQDWSSENPITDANMDTAYDASLAGTKDAVFLTLSVTTMRNTFYSDFLDTTYISTTDSTYYSLRSSNDFDNTAPTTSEYVYIYSADATLSSQKPALIVNYYEMVDAEQTTWLLEIDWDGFSNEANRITRFKLDRGRDQTIGSPGRGFEAPQVGRLTVDLDNYDNRYDPWNKEGDLYGLLRPGVRVNFAAIYRSVYYNLFTGFIRDIQPRGFRKYVTLTIEDGAGWLRERTPDIPMLTSATVSRI
jgi:hypothetical protein